MTSLLAGYEYDIFISYRQKDNRYDGWVTEFVSNLKKELEATFKEDITAYFDINTHDGLLETHDVNDSLKEKLRCLLFIPVISRTYCDPKSFAWEHEFKAFIELASNDQFGLKVKLPNGNVSSRILPVMIHTLGDEDKILLEKELGGQLRAIDFIYKEPGVNRPLTPDDDEKKNLNNIKYRNQINKLANAIEEIILGLKNNPAVQTKAKTIYSDSSDEIHPGSNHAIENKPARLKQVSLISGAVILTLLIIAGLFTFPKAFRHNDLNKLRSTGQRISVAVMPFQNMTNDTTLNIWQDGIQFNVITSLSNSADLKVRQTESTNNLLHGKGIANYALMTPSDARSVSQKLDADVFIYGNINAAGGKIRVSAQLIYSKTEEVFKSFQIDGELNEVLMISDSLASLIKNYLVLSTLKNEVSIEFNTVMPVSVEAYKYFILGYKAFFKSDNLAAIRLFSQSLEIDSTYVNAYIWLALSYANQGMFDKAEKWSVKAYEKKESLPFDLRIWANLLYARYHEKSINEELNFAKQLLEMDEKIPLNHWAVAVPYYNLHQYSNAIPELQKMFEIYKTWNIKPLNSGFYLTLINSYHEAGKYKEEKKLLKKATEDFPGDLHLIGCQIILFFSQKDTVNANKFIEEYLSVCKENSVPDAEVKTNLAEIYSLSRITDKAERYYRKALESDPGNPDMLYNLARFLINSNKNPDEGLDLVNKALEKDPENSSFLNTKGWGLYRLGRYQEALKILEKSDSLKPVFSYSLFLHIQEVKKALDNPTLQK